MDSIKYIGLDVHQSTLSVAVLDADGNLVMQSVIATHAATLLDFLHGLRGTLHVTFEEGTPQPNSYNQTQPISEERLNFKAPLPLPILSCGARCP